MKKEIEFLKHELEKLKAEIAELKTKQIHAFIKLKDENSLEEFYRKYTNQK